MRIAYYAGVSTAAAAACLLKAFHDRPNFYSATVYLSQSYACLLILTNLLLIIAGGFMYGLQRLLYGPLRPIEIEQMSEKAWYAVLDTLLAMPSFREDVGGWLLAMFTLLLAGKVWGWIGEGKVDVLEQQPPANPTLFHTRLAASLIVSVLFDLWMLDYCIETVLVDPRPGMMVIFTFEFAILTVSSGFTLSRYLLSVMQLRIEKAQMKKAMSERVSEIAAERAAERQRQAGDGQTAPEPPANEDAIEVDENELDVPGWEEKRRYLFALEVFTDFIKLMIYIVFFTVSITFNGLPMHIMRDVYMTFASFSKRISSFVAYRKATSDMNTRYPDATTEEIRGDSCIVCRESMIAWEQTTVPPQAAAQGQAQPAPDQPPQPSTRRRDEGLRAKKLPCGHILHLRCLKAWLERQQVCPTCRSPVVPVRDAAPAAQGQQPAAPGANANPPAPGQPQDPAAQRGQGRARVLNLGPVRIGFLNGPGDQIQNLLRQMQNPRQPAAPANPAPPAGNQQGPNHLGLDPPYPVATPQPSQSTPTSTESTQLQIARLELRLAQEARNLGIEQQQLSTLLMMEQEMVRLRALRQGSGAAPMATTQPGLQAAGRPMAPYQMRPMMPLNPMAPFPQLHHQHHHHHDVPFDIAALRGFQGQQYSNGHESLPQGMTLPEGWTVMPLQRMDAAADGRVPIVLTSADGQANQAASGHGSQPTPLPTESAAAADTRPNIGPTDGNGSPLFVPTAPSTNGVPPSVTVTDAAAPATTSAHANTPADPVPAAAHQPQPATEQRVPWNSDEWSFVDAPNGHAADVPAAAESSNADERTQPHANGTPAAPGEQPYDGKGKGKAQAAAVEDAPESDD